MRKARTILITTLSTCALFALCLVAGCRKHSCYSAALQEQYTRVDCVNDCPGVTGCDGKKYCNVCIAASQGIEAW